MALNKRVLLAVMVLGSLAIAMAEEVSGAAASASAAVQAEPAKKKEEYGDDYDKHEKHEKHEKVRGEAVREGRMQSRQMGRWLNWFCATSPHRHPLPRTFRYRHNTNAGARLPAACGGTARSVAGLTAADGQQDSNPV
jgi:hypothetical protein